MILPPRLAKSWARREAEPVGHQVLVVQKILVWRRPKEGCSLEFCSMRQGRLWAALGLPKACAALAERETQPHLEIGRPLDPSRRLCQASIRHSFMKVWTLSNFKLPRILSAPRSSQDRLISVGLAQLD